MMSDDETALLTPYCSQLKPVDRQFIADMHAEIGRVVLPWTVNYSEYQSGGWKTLALYNADGNSQSNDLDDGAPRPTEVTRALPHTRRFIETSGLSLMWARLLRLEPGAYLWEHTDYGAENLGRRERLRLHLPLETNPRAVLVLPSSSIHMQLGYLWKLAPHETRHAACNDGQRDRLHLILDCYVDEPLRQLVSTETLDPACVRHKPTLTERALLDLAAEADALRASGSLDAAESLFRQAFHRFALGATSSYDLLIHYLESRGQRERSQHWRRERLRFLNADVAGHPFFEAQDPCAAAR